MVKNIFIAIFVSISLMLAGCAKNLGVYDPSVSQEKLCTLEIDVELLVNQFNGSSVDWYKYPGVIIQIPVGHHTFLMNYYSGGQYSTRSARDIRYSYTFEAGKTYLMKPVISGRQVSVEVKTK
jgi:hypothetical protein